VPVADPGGEVVEPSMGGRGRASEVVERGRRGFARVDPWVIGALRRISLPLLRISLGIVFVWFGALKIFDVTPVAELVANTVYWLDASWVVPALGVAEVIVGLGLLTGRALRAVLLLFAGQMIGTFLVLLVQPDVAFIEGNPLLLTTEGEFVVKNLVLLSAGLVVGSALRPAGEREPVPSVDA
jgi:putative oxidoreductase